MQGLLLSHSKAPADTNFFFKRSPWLSAVVYGLQSTFEYDYGLRPAPDGTIHLEGRKRGSYTLPKALDPEPWPSRYNDGAARVRRRVTKLTSPTGAAGHTSPVFAARHRP